MTNNQNFEIGPLIARGATADIYAWGAKQVIKLFRIEWPETRVDHEYRIVKTIYSMDISSPAVGEKVKVSGRCGIIFERIDGQSMLEVMLKKPWQTEPLAAEFAQIHAGINHRKTTELPSQRKRLSEKIKWAPKLTDSEKAQTLKRLESLPDGSEICHGDFHPGIIILSPRGPVIIDWVDATSGNPDADLARTVLLINKLKTYPEQYGFVNRMTLDFIKELFYSYYIKAYGELRSFSFEELHAWLPVVAAARLEENIPGEEKQLLQLIRNPR